MMCPHCKRSITDVTGSVYTPRDICRGFGIPISMADRICFQYRDRLPQPLRVGNVRLYGFDVIESFAACLRAEGKPHTFNERKCRESKAGHQA